MSNYNETLNLLDRASHNAAAHWLQKETEIRLRNAATKAYLDRQLMIHQRETRWKIAVCLVITIVLCGAILGSL